MAWRRATRFRTTIELGGKAATGMQVPPEVVEALNAGKRAPVRVTIEKGAKEMDTLSSTTGGKR